jgi:hypothetical protein
MATDDPHPQDDATLKRSHRKRRWQFGLRALLLVVTASAVVSWWYAREEPWEQFQQRLTERVEGLGGEIEWGSEESPTRLSFHYWGFSGRKPLTDEQLKDLRRDLGRLGPFTLNLSGSQNARGAITDAGLEHLAGLLRLECLSLRHNDVTDAGLQHLTRLKGLQFIDLEHTKVTDQAASGAVSVRPGLIVRKYGAISISTANSTSWKAPHVEYVSVTATNVGDTPAIFLGFGLGQTERLCHVHLDGHLMAHDPKVKTCFLAKDDVVVSLHGRISDSGVQLLRVDLAGTQPTVVWKTFAQPLGVGHSKYDHDAHVFVHGDRCVLVSDGAATFVEIRDLATGALLKRWVY